MGYLLVPLHGGFGETQTQDVTPYGHETTWAWDGAEIGFLRDFPEVLAAVSEAEMRDWFFGVHYPLIQRDPQHWAPNWLHPDPAEQARARQDATAACADAAAMGARYILLHYPWPALLEPGLDYPARGWKIPDASQPLALWPRERLRDVSLRAFEALAGAGAQRKIQVVVEFDGPNAHFFGPEGEPDLFTELFTTYPELSLCVDTGRLDLLARTHGGDALTYTRRWLPWAKHVHLHGAQWDAHRNHLPPLPEHEGATGHTAGYAPAAEMARTILAAHPQANVVLETNPRLLGPDDRRRSFDYCRQLVR